MVYPLFDGFDHSFGIGAFQHHDLSQYFFAFSVTGNGPETGGVTKAHLPHVFYVNGHTGTALHNNIFDILHTGGQPFSPNKVGLILALDIATTGHTVIRFQRTKNLAY